MTTTDDPAERHLSKALLQLSLKDHHSAKLLLSKELLQLPQQKRSAIEEEIHGVSTLALKESPEFLESSLQDLSKELTNIPGNNPIKKAYIKSQMIPNTYVNTKDFRLRFLRCELFDAKKAALRMVRFLDFASDLFGSEILRRPITMSDFSKKEKEIMKQGHVQILPYRDQTGRQIWAFVGEIFSPLETALYKINMYQHYIMSNDIETQQKGIVFLSWPCSLEHGEPFPRGEKNTSEVLLNIGASRIKFLSSVPTRWSAIQWCLPNKPRYHILQAACAILSGDAPQLRTRFHYGTLLELRYKLKTFGIHVDSIPYTGSGKIKTTYLKQWMKARECLENNETKEKVLGNKPIALVLCPCSNDVLFRPGVSMAFHRGNAIFQNAIEDKFQEHGSATQTQKRAIVKGIITGVTEQKGRFLQWNPKHGWWEEFEETSKIHEKVAIAIRDFRAKLVAHRTKNRQIAESSTYVFQALSGNRKRRKLSESDKSNSDCWCIFDVQGKKCVLEW